jgi:death on curing protein
VSERWTPALDDYIELAAYLLDVEPSAVRALPRITLAESAVHASFASFGGQAAYPSLIEQAAVLIEHLAKNHPLPDGNKRAAFLLTARFLDANGLTWGSPDVELDGSMVERIAAGQAARDEIVAWIARRTSPGRSQ